MQSTAFAGDQPSLPQPPEGIQKLIVAQRAVGGFWRADHTFRASIRITNNLAIAPLNVAPVLYMAGGTRFALPFVQIPEQSVAVVDVNDALSTAPPEVAAHLSKYGGAALEYNWRRQAAVAGSILNLDIPRSHLHLAIRGAGRT